MTYLKQAGKLYAELTFPLIDQQHIRLLENTGMIDVSIHNDAESYIKRELAQAICRRDSLPEENYKTYEPFILSKSINEFTQAVALGLMSLADMNV